MRLGDEEIRSLVKEFGELAGRGAEEGLERSVMFAEGLAAGEMARVYDAATRIAFEEFGRQHLFGGPGPWIRWQTADYLIQLEHSSWAIRMSLLPRRETEQSEYRVCEWGDRDYVAAEVGVWVAEYNGGGMWGGYSPGGKLAPDWDTFQEWVVDTVHTLGRDLRILDMELSIVLTPVRGDARVIEVVIGPGRIRAVASQPHHMDSQTLGGLGWQSQDGAWSLVLDAPSFENIERLATLITATLRAYGLELHRVSYSTSCRYSSWVNLLGLGVKHM